MTESSPRDVLGIIAGNGIYPQTLIKAARKQVPGIKIIVCAFINETRPELAEDADIMEWFRVGQISKPMAFFRKNNVKEAVMVGQIAPSNLFSLRPDLAALKLLYSIRERNAETIFGRVANYLEKEQGIKILLATTYMGEHLPQEGLVFGPKFKQRQWDDAQFGMSIAKKISKMDIGQTVLVRHGTVLAVEGFEGTNECIKRGGMLGKGKDVILCKVSKPHQDIRFDVPCVGPQTIQCCADSGVSSIVIDAGRTILLEAEKVQELCHKHKITLYAMDTAPFEN